MEPMINGTGRDFSPQFNATAGRLESRPWWPNKDGKPFK
jgi:hypothetical protein